RDEIGRAGGWIGFARYMELALYAPGLGYYMAGARKLGPEGDFVTAPEISPLFGQTLARQVAQVLDEGLDDVMEIGAGSGALAASLLAELEHLGALPKNYFILELSPDLRQRSRDTIAARVPQLMERVAWLNRLPPEFSGIVLGNEVLDAMPVHVVRTRASALVEAGVEATGAQGFRWAYRPAQGELLEAARELALPDGYTSEIGLLSRAFIASIGEMIERGAAIFIDYGFPRSEYYHPQRSEGTLMCHYRHHAHADPFYLPGLQDITAHVDFSALARSAERGGLELLGYTTQAQFLINCGITEVLGRVSPEDAARYLPLSNQANRLLSPSEMGELFKAIAFGKKLGAPLIGFSSGDKRHTL
ncbi:MAG: SAM-dependent methyltransferase, partial [Betaproteobacteria bacterium]|nr:SAM-dependent methyltransferase [Betaproteobacteria bacterium]